jgi:hypothetical protein
MRIDKIDGKIFVRQSWLNDMVICPERARYGVLRPDFRIGSDATIMGTAVHTGIEHVLRGEADFDAMVGIVADEYGELAKQPHKQTNINQELIPDYLQSMCKSFYDSVLPQVKLGGLIEHRFNAPLGCMVDGYAVWVEGTMDYVDPDGIIWDWKTSSRAYNIKDKQKSSIQASVYSVAAVQTGLAEGYPVDFRYGVMVRHQTPKAQVVSLVRNHAHTLWLQQFTKGAINTAVNVGYDNNWFMNDTSALCSEQWCSFWSICKGAFVKESDNAFPQQVNVE